MISPYIFAGLKPQPQHSYKIKMKYHLNDDQIEIMTAAIYDALGADFITIKSRRHTRSEVEARQIAMYLIKKHLGCTLRFIGSYFGRDYSTVIYALETVKDMIASNRQFADKVSNVEKLFL